MQNSEKELNSKIVCLLLTLTAGFFTFYKVPLGDVWIHLAQGRYILQNGIVPDTDVLSFTYYGKPWSNWEWLHNVFSALFWYAFSFNGIIFFRFLIAAGILLVLYSLSYNISRNPLISYAVVSFSFPIFQLRIVDRPVFLSYLFLAVVVSIVWRNLYERKHMVLALILLMIWRNTHPSWVFGVVFWVGGYIDALISGRQERSWSSVLRDMLFLCLVVVATIFVTPVRFDFSSYSFLQDSKGFAEWTALYDLHHTIILRYYMPYILFSLILLPALFLRIKDYFLVTILTVAMLVNTVLHARFMAESVILGVPFILHALSGISLKYHMRLKPLVLAGLIFAFTLSWGQINFSMSPVHRGVGVDESMLPVYLAEFMSENYIGGNIYSSHVTAMEFLAFYLSPKAKVTVDIRIPGLYPIEFAQKYWDINNERDFRSLVLSLPLDHIILGRPDIRAWQEHDLYFERLLLAEGWQLLYFDRRFALYRAPIPATERGAYSSSPFKLFTRWNGTEETITEVAKDEVFPEMMKELRMLKRYTAGRDDFYREVMVALYSASSLNEEQKKALEEVYNEKVIDDAEF